MKHSWLLGLAFLLPWAPGCGSGRSPDPSSYQGRQASEWASELYAEDPLIAEKAAAALAHLGDLGADELAKAFAADQGAAGMRALSYIHHCGPNAIRRLAPQIVPALVKKLQRSNGPDLIDTLQYCADLGPVAAETIPDLQRLAASTNPQVRSMAKAALQAVQGKRT